MTDMKLLYTTLHYLNSLVASFLLYSDLLRCPLIHLVQIYRFNLDAFHLTSRSTRCRVQYPQSIAHSRRLNSHTSLDTSVSWWIHCIGWMLRVSANANRAGRANTDRW